MLHSDKGANFESKVINSLCEIAGVKKSRITPYHPIGNGMVERYNKTLLNMLGTLSDDKKADWKSYVSTMTHAYNAAEHESTGYAPFFLMFGRHPRLAIDAFLGLKQHQDTPCSHQDYVGKLKQRLGYAYDKASKEAKRSADKHKKYYDQKVKFFRLEPGDRVLVRNVGLRGKQKLADIWGKHPYIVKSKPVPDIPVYEVQQENSKAKSKLLHRNMLLPFFGLPIPSDPKPRRPIRQQKASETGNEYDADSSSSSTEQIDDTSTIPRMPQRRRRNLRQQTTQTSSKDSELSEIDTRTRDTTIQGASDGQVLSDFQEQSSEESSGYSSSNREQTRRGSRQRQPPQWIRTGEWQLQHQPFTILVDPSQIVQL